MTRSKNLRRVAILCCHCLRNLAFCNSGLRNGEPKLNGQFWVNVNGNFLDIAILEWCKLFAETRGKHFWRKVISHHESFQEGLLVELSLTETEFDDYRNQIRSYRDKFVAHLDSDDAMYIPPLQIAVESTVYLYDYLLENEETGGCFADAPKGGFDFYEKFFHEGTTVYEEEA